MITEVGNPKNMIEQNQALADSIKTYVYSMLQTALWLLGNKQ